MMRSGSPSEPGAASQDELFAALAAAAAGDGTAAMFESLARSLRDRQRWHALFDLRLLEARSALGLPPAGELGDVAPADRDALDERSLAACREVGWPLLAAGQVAAAWMYLRAAVAPAEIAGRLAALADEALGDGAGRGEDEALDERLQEILHVALWEGVDPALGIGIVIRTQGTCNAITAYEQGVSRLPARRQEAAAGVLVDHLHSELARSLAAEIAHRGIPLAAAFDPPPSLEPLLAALHEAAGEGAHAIHVDVSHLQSVLRIARVCADPDVVRRAHEIACYACRVPAEMTYPGEPPFEQVGEASRLFFGAQIGRDVDAAITHFRRAAAVAKLEESGTLPADTLVLLLSRLGRHREALHAALERPAASGMPSVMLASGMIPSLVELAAAADSWDELLAACRERGDEITFAAALAARRRSPGTA